MILPIGSRALVKARNSASSNTTSNSIAGDHMSSKSYGESYIGEIHEEDNEAGGVTLIVEGAFPSNAVDWSNYDNVKIAASRALDIADELYEMIQRDCNLDDPVFGNKNVAVYIAMSAFSCELYLKGMIYLENGHQGRQIRIHSLYKLLELLSQHSHLDNRLTELMGRASEIDMAFNEMRYVFEFNAFNKDYLLVFDLLEELRVRSLGYQRHSAPRLQYSGGKVVIG